MILTAPNNISKRDYNEQSIFLAGSIDNGSAADWQNLVAQRFSSLGWNVFNPRRTEWNSELEQSATNPVFYQQVMWEKTALQHSDVILMNFEAGSIAPISLLELGFCAADSVIYVVCPEGFWRKGNVDMVCQIYNIPVFDTLIQAIEHIIQNH